MRSIPLIPSLAVPGRSHDYLSAVGAHLWTGSLTGSIGYCDRSVVGQMLTMSREIGSTKIWKCPFNVHA